MTLTLTLEVLLGMASMLAGVIVWTHNRLRAVENRAFTLIETCRAECHGHTETLKESLHQQAIWTRDTYAPQRAMDAMRAEIMAELRGIRRLVECRGEGAHDA